VLSTRTRERERRGWKREVTSAIGMALPSLPELGDNDEKMITAEGRGKDVFFKQGGGRKKKKVEWLGNARTGEKAEEYAIGFAKLVKESRYGAEGGMKTRKP